MIVRSLAPIKAVASPAWKIGSTPHQVTSGNSGAGQAGGLARESPWLTAGHLGVWYVCGTP